MEIRILRHRLTEVLPRVIIRSVPWPHWPKHVVFDISLVLKMFPQIVIDCRRKGVQPRGQLTIIIRAVACVHFVNTEISRVQSTDGKPLISEQLLPEVSGGHIQVTF